MPGGTLKTVQCWALQASKAAVGAGEAAAVSASDLQAEKQTPGEASLAKETFRASRGYQSLEDAGLRCCMQCCLLLREGKLRGPFGRGWWGAGCTQPGSCGTRAGLPCDPWGLNSIPVCFCLGVLGGARCTLDMAGAGYGAGGPSAGDGAVALTRWAALWRNSPPFFILQFFRQA